jgi:hypothetical protein
VKCTVDKDGIWSFAGTLKNASPYVSHYSVTVSVASRDTGVVFGTSSQSYAVKPGRSLAITLNQVANSSGVEPSTVSCGHLVSVVRDR